MKRLLTILLLIVSANVFGQLQPQPSGTLTPLTTNQAYFRASDSTYYFYNGTNYLWNYFLNKQQADKLYQPINSPSATPFSLSTGYGLVGSSFDGSVARTWTADTASAGGLVSKSRLATNLGGYVPSSRTITINGATRDLSTNRVWNVGTVTSVGANAGTGISVTGSPITSSGNITITNTAPDQTVVLTAGTGISTSGTYPNFTITNTSPSPSGLQDSLNTRVKKSGDTMTGTLNGTDIILSDNLQADTVKGTAAIFNSSSKTLQVQFSGANVLSVNSTLAGASAPGGVYVNTLISGATQLSNLTVTNLNAGGLVKAVSPSGLFNIATPGTDYLAPGTAVLLTGNQSIAGNKTFTDDVNITGTDGTPSLTVTASGSVSRAISASTSGSSSIAIIADGTSGASGVVASAGNGAYGVQGNNTGSGWGGAFTSVSGPAIATVSTSGVGGTFQSGSANIAEFYGSGATLNATVAQSGLISSTPQGTLYGTASGSITSSQLATSLSDETGTGNAVFSANPTFTGTISAAAAGFTGAVNLATSSGNVLIGTTTDSGYKLDVNGTGRFSGALTGTSATFSGQITSTVTSNAILFNNSGNTSTQYFDISNTGGRFLLGNNNSGGSSLGSGGLAYSTVLTAVGATALQFGTNSVMRYTIDASGNNTWTGDGTFNGRLIVGVSSGFSEVSTSATLLDFYQPGASSAIRFRVNGAVEAARFTAAGFFKASNDGTYVSVSGAYHELRSNQADWALQATNSHGSNPSGIYIKYTNSSPNNASNYLIRGDDNTGIKFGVSSNGGVANYSANNVNLSDERAKKNIIKAGSYWNIIKAIEFDSYKYKDQKDSRMLLGVMAQQVEKINPAWVSNSGSFGKASDGTNLKSVYEQQLQYGVNIVVQESMKRIEALEAEVKLLKSK